MDNGLIFKLASRVSWRLRSFFCVNLYHIMHIILLFVRQTFYHYACNIISLLFTVCNGNRRSKNNRIVL